MKVMYVATRICPAYHVTDKIVPNKPRTYLGHPNCARDISGEPHQCPGTTIGDVA